MSRSRRVSFAESAVADLEGIRAWYTEQQVPQVGARLIGEILARVASLAEYPQRGRVVPEFEAPALREVLLPPFRIVYRLDGHRVRVVRIWRCERLMGLDGLT